MGISFNPYAAMPSMHVGWSLLIGLAGRRAARSTALRTFFLVHPALMALTVVATGNHYLLDGVAGVTVAATALLLIGALRRAPRVPGRAAARGRTGRLDPIGRD